MRKVKVMIIDDHEVVRRGFRSLETEPDLEVVGEVADGFDALEIISNLQPNVVIMTCSSLSSAV